MLSLNVKLACHDMFYLQAGGPDALPDQTAQEGRDPEADEDDKSAANAEQEAEHVVMEKLVARFMTPQR